MLILTEKSSVANDFAIALNAQKFAGYFATGNTIITYCQGHLFELCPPDFYDPKYKNWNITDLPIIPQKFCYSKTAAASSQTKIVMEKIKEHISDKIIIATDADREGELIARIVLEQAHLTDLSKCYRFWVSEALTPDVVKKGLENAKPLSEYNSLSLQAYARQHADWLIGINFTRFVSTGNHEIFSVGRVQTAVLFEIAKRNYEVKNFIPKPYNELEAEIRDSNGNIIKALLVNPKDNKCAFELNSQYLLSAMNKCSSRKIDFAKSDSVLKTSKPEKLLNINALEKEAYKRFGYSPEETLNIAEELYNEHKCLSYPRTPSRVMGDANVEIFREKFELLKNFYPEISGFCNPKLINQENKHIFDSSKLESHHALIPLAKLPENANQKQKNVFGIVIESFFRVCMDDYKYNEKTIHFSCNGFTFKSVIKDTVQEGWKAYERRNVTAMNDTKKENEIQEVRNFNENNCLITSLKKLDKKTTPPKEYSIDTLLTFMEKPKGDTEEKLVGLGTPATRADIVQKLFKTGYIIEDKKKLYATKKGLWLLTFLSKDKELAKIANVNQTTYWENELAVNPSLFEQHIKEYVAVSMKPEIKEVYVKEGICKCPDCGKDIQKGKSNWYCTGYKEGCKFVLWENVAGAKLSEKDVTALCNGKQTGIKHCTNKAGKKFDCKFVLNEKKEIKFEFINSKNK